jgi:hypothetical protein
VVERFGLRSWYLFAAAVTTLGPLWALVSPVVRQLDNMQAPEPAPVLATSSASLAQRSEIVVETVAD